LTGERRKRFAGWSQPRRNRTGSRQGSGPLSPAPDRQAPRRQGNEAASQADHPAPRLRNPAAAIATAPIAPPAAAQPV